MTYSSEIPTHPLPPTLRQRILSRARTRPGRWSFALAILSILLFMINLLVFFPTASEASWGQILLLIYAWGMFACGLAAGMLGLLAILKLHERSWQVWLGLLVGLWLLIYLLGDFLIPH